MYNNKIGNSHVIYILGVRGILDFSSVLLTTIVEPIKEELIKSKLEGRGNRKRKENPHDQCVRFSPNKPEKLQWE